MALRALATETGEDRFSEVQAILRKPADQAEAYVAMVQENEIRADLSFFERARIAIKALESGVFESEKQALQTLFSAASYSRRSKIKSFIRVVEALDGTLRFPASLTERTGLHIARNMLSDQTLVERLHKALLAKRPDSPEMEQAVVQSVLDQPAPTAPAPLPETDDAGIPAKTPPRLDLPDVQIKVSAGKVVLTGEKVDSGFDERLKRWLATQA